MATVEEARVPLLSAQESLPEDSDELKDNFDVNYRLQGPRSYSKLPGPENHTSLVLLGGEEAQEGENGARGKLKRVGSEQTAVAGSTRRRQQYSGSEMIVAVFVVAFDTKRGECCL